MRKPTRISAKTLSLTLVLAAAWPVGAQTCPTVGLVLDLTGTPRSQDLGRFLGTASGAGLGAYLWLQRDESRFAFKPRMDFIDFGVHSGADGQRRARVAFLGMDFPIIFTKGREGWYCNNGLALARWTILGPEGSGAGFGLAHPALTTSKWSGSLGLGLRKRQAIAELNIITSRVTPLLKPHLAELSFGWAF